MLFKNKLIQFSLRAFREKINPRFRTIYISYNRLALLYEAVNLQAQQKKKIR